VKLGNSFSCALRTFAYFMSSGTHSMLEGIDYLSLSVRVKQVVAFCCTSVLIFPHNPLMTSDG
jgi:hypothetical protein